MQNILVRVGGGWQELKTFLQTHDKYAAGALNRPVLTPALVDAARTTTFKTTTSSSPIAGKHTRRVPLIKTLLVIQLDCTPHAFR